MPKIKRWGLATLLALFMQHTAAGEPTGSYVGILPCADCPGIEIRLDVLPDGAFHQRSIYRERPGRFYAIGRWQLDDTVLRLDYQNGDTSRLALEGGSLTLLDGEGRKFDSRHQHTLNRSPRLGRLEPRVTLEGHFTYYADSATLHDCATERRMPVAMEGQYLRLERAWSHSRTTLARPLPVVVQGRIVERVNMEGPTRPTVIVERVISAGKPVRCAPATVKAPAPTEPYDTRWQLVEVAGSAVADRGERSAHIVFTDGTPARVAGSTGCNRFSGNATLIGGSLLFGALASTKMACLDQNTHEQDFLSALDATRGWRIRDGRLELLDAAKRTLAAFAPH